MIATAETLDQRVEHALHEVRAKVKPTTVEKLKTTDCLNCFEGSELNLRGRLDTAERTLWAAVQFLFFALDHLDHERMSEEKEVQRRALGEAYDRALSNYRLVLETRKALGIRDLSPG